MSEIDNLLDQTLDDLSDLPEFAPLHAGAHRVIASMDIKEIKGHGKCPEIAFKLIETIELSDPQQEPQAEGAETSCLFMLDNEFGQGKFKAVAGQFAEFAGTSQLSGIIEAVTDVECILLSSVRPDKNDATKLYMNIVEISVV